MLRSLLQLVVIFLLVLTVAGAPLMIGIRGEAITIQPESFVIHTVKLLEDISSGSLGTYYLGENEREIAEDIWRYAENSFFLLFSSMLIAVGISIVFGIFLHRFGPVRIVQRFFDVMSTIPDFVQVLFALTLAISFYKWTGIRLVTLSPFSENKSFWFPVLVLSLGPTLYLLKLVTLKYYQTSAEDYIRTALAKGLNVWHINLHHVFKNIKPFLIADLKKAISVSLANLFMVEYLLNVVGVTRFIFGGYQFNAVAIGLFILLVLSTVVYLSIRLILYVFERGLVYE
ncbi:ABC transporter permease subunit [Brevibacillus humidisoli]|uniref:ABC transporter permease subunit n=1 Tax=Brevibacillus humidisoli TaxID=2895522 RepID=UPI001E317BE3|nr:ABC transporter permease subunit [Brevibacillus humidisoli]UFJ39112.1 ABC transporter permease subunit [Brevibacillus humidisoli]